MTPTLNHFLTFLKTLGVAPIFEFVPSKLVETSETSPSLVIPPKNDDVGCLTIHDDGDEVTVEIGRLHHTHFSGYNYLGENSEKRLLAATEAAAQFVADVLADRVFFGVDYVDGRCIGSSSGYLDADTQPIELLREPNASLTNNEAMRSDLFVWSGPVGAID